MVKKQNLERYHIKPWPQLHLPEKPLKHLMTPSRWVLPPPSCKTRRGFQSNNFIWGKIPLRPMLWGHGAVNPHAVQPHWHWHSQAAPDAPTPKPSHSLASVVSGAMEWSTSPKGIPWNKSSAVTHFPHSQLGYAHFCLVSWKAKGSFPICQYTSTYFTNV